MHPDLTALQQAAQGLSIISETDAPLEAVAIDNGNSVETALRRLCGAAADTTVEVRDARPFLENQQRMHNEGADAARFSTLRDQLLHTLPDLRLYRIGNVSIDAFLLGTLPDGTRGGLRTRLVET